MKELIKKTKEKNVEYFYLLTFGFQLPEGSGASVGGKKQSSVSGTIWSSKTSQSRLI